MTANGCFSVDNSNVGVVRLRQPGGSIPECGPGRGINYNNGIFHHYSLPRHFTPSFHTFHTLLPLVNSILTLPLPCFPWNDKVADSVKCMKYFLVSIQIFSCCNDVWLVITFGRALLPPARPSLTQQGGARVRWYQGVRTILYLITPIIPTSE